MTNRKLSLQKDKVYSLQFAARLKELVDSYESASALAREVGVVEGTIRKWANGTSQPKVGEIVKLVQTLGANLLWLVTGEGPKYLEQRGVMEPEPKYQDPSMPFALRRHLGYMRQAVLAVEMMGKEANEDRKMVAMERVFERLAQTEGQADMIEVMRIIRGALGDPAA